jgi:hypothetical protein
MKSFGGDQGGVHAQLHAGLSVQFAAAGDTQQFDAVAQLLGVANIVSFQLADTFDMRPVKLHGNAKGECRQNGDLVCGIHAPSTSNVGSASA